MTQRQRALIVLTLILGLTGASWWVWYRMIGRYYVSTNDAYVHGDRIPITSQQTGTVVTIDVSDTQPVTAGHLLLRLDGTRARLSLASAQASLAEAVREAEIWRARVQEDEAALQAARSTARLAVLNARRARRLLVSHVDSRQEEQTAHNLAVIAVRRVDLIATRLAADEIRAGTGPLRNLPLIRHAMVRLEQAWVDLARTVIRAPVAGIVVERRVELGERVHPGQTLMLLVPLHDVWVDANFKESELRRIHIGQPVTMHATIYGSSVVYRGEVLGLSAGTGEAFSLIPPENATGNWIQIVQRLPVRIGFAPGTLSRYPLRLGLSMSVTVDTRKNAQRPRRVLPIHPLRKTSLDRDQWSAARAYALRLLAKDEGYITTMHHPAIP